VKKDQFVFLQHIVDRIGDIQGDVNGLTKEQFLEKKTIIHSVLWSIGVIGEAAKNISAEFRKEHKDIPWKQISGMRDKLIHEYFGIDLGNVWKVVTEDIPVLKKKIEEILKKRTL